MFIYPDPNAPPERVRVDNDLSNAAQEFRELVTSFIPWLNSQVTHTVLDWHGVQLNYYADGRKVGTKTFARSEVFRLLGRDA